MLFLLLLLQMLLRILVKDLLGNDQLMLDDSLQVFHQRVIRLPILIHLIFYELVLQRLQQYIIIQKG